MLTRPHNNPPHNVPNLEFGCLRCLLILLLIDTHYTNVEAKCFIFDFKKNYSRMFLENAKNVAFLNDEYLLPYYK